MGIRNHHHIPAAALTCLLLFPFFTIAQTKDTSAQASRSPKIQFAVFDGIIVAGYVDGGAYLNFTGPSIAWGRKKSRLSFGMMPSLRIKEDNATPHNSLVTPSLGFGVTYCYRKLALQVPFYYNPKTSTSNGTWNVGVGIGLRLKT